MACHWEVPNSDVRSWVSSRMGLVRVASPRPSDWHGMTLPLWTVVAATFRRKTFRRKPVLSFKQSGAPLERSSGGHHMSDPAHGEQLPPSHPDACQKVRTKSRRWRRWRSRRRPWSILMGLSLTNHPVARGPHLWKPGLTPILQQSPLK